MACPGIALDFLPRGVPILLQPTANPVLHTFLHLLDRVRPALIADGLAELQVRWPSVPIVFCETRPLAEEWTYRFLAAAHTWASTETAALQRISDARVDIATPAPPAEGPSTAEVRAWARAAGLPVPDRGRLRPEVWQSWRDAHPSTP
ncbi:hypothetical protein GCM10010409_20340 [Mycolicibacterium diernhoferi]|uniref:Lsr2 DNA-binding domain-containing protein n=1 Tax=Mycolicibacterium diernhoferi TaxID=1801 RepID=A0A2A7NZ46_9MYCO|nr:hypothetical protein CRI78_06210 [Mycolicibacterium diernhoferi]